MNSTYASVKMDPETVTSILAQQAERHPADTGTGAGSVPGQTIIDAVETAELCSGYGQYHSAKSERNPKPYSTITIPAIKTMAKNPPRMAKGEAQWAIFSTLLSRKYSEQFTNGLFFALWADIDKAGGLAFLEIISRAGGVIPNFIAYTTKGATEDNQKTRLIVPQAEPVTGETFVILQKILNDKLKAEGIEPDRATERTGQPCYLPNRGEYYQYHIDDCLSPMAPSDWAGEIAQEQARVEAEQKAIQSRMEAARQKAVERMQSGCTSPIEAFKAEFPIELMLDRYAYQKIGNRWLSPNSDSKNPGVIVTDDREKWLSPHGGDSEIGMATKNGARMGDAFDLFTHYEHGGNRDAAIRAAGEMFVTPTGKTITEANRDAYRQANTRTAPKTSEATTIKPDGGEGGRIAEEIRRQLAEMLQIDQAGAEISELGIDADVITRMIRGSFWSGNKSKLFLLTRSGSLNQYHATDAFKFLSRTFGKPIDHAKLKELVEKFKPDREPGRFIREACNIPKQATLDHLMYHSQRDSIEWRVDMFALADRMEIREDKVRVILKHKPFPNQGPWEPEIITDFKEHFTRYDDFLDFLVMSRFTIDRKKAYLWLRADTDWGKGFILGILKKMNAAVETSMREIEAMLEGKPVGRTPEDFKRAFVLVIDEFKTVKSELKQLQSEISLSPKNQLTSTVEVFAKLFLSAESVGSLVTENGVEDQFANRMSIFDEYGSLVKRKLYQEVGNPRYFQSVLAYTADRMNRKVEEMRQLGELEAQTTAERWLNDFILRYGLDTLYERFSASLPALAETIAETWRSQEWSDEKIRREGSEVFILSPSKMLRGYLEDNYDNSQIPALWKKREDLLKMISEDGRGPRPHWIGGKQYKAVKLKRYQMLP